MKKNKIKDVGFLPLFNVILTELKMYLSFSFFIRSGDEPFSEITGINATIKDPNEKYALRAVKDIIKKSRLPFVIEKDPDGKKIKILIAK